VKIFVTGIAGFLGAHIAREALDLGWEVAGIDSMLSAVTSTASTASHGSRPIVAIPTAMPSCSAMQISSITARQHPMKVHQSSRRK
jgi:GDP-D-mannose dehydratase